MQPTAQAVGPRRISRQPRRGERNPALAVQRLRLIPIPLADEIRPGDSLADKLLDSLRRHRLRLQSGDILVVKHKIVSKSEGRIVDLATIDPSDESIAWAKQYALDARVIELALRESRAVIRRKNGVLITETHHGFLCANSGVDVSNVDGGQHALLLPEDPDRSAANLRRALKKRTGLLDPRHHHRQLRPSVARRPDRICHWHRRNEAAARRSRPPRSRTATN